MARTFPAACDWQTQPPRDRVRKTVRGHTLLRGPLRRGTASRYVPSWGGSMFEALMPMLFLDEATLAPRKPRPQRRRATSPCSAAIGTSRSATRCGACRPATGPAATATASSARARSASSAIPTGAVTPHAAALALAVDARRGALANLRRLATDCYDATATSASTTPSTRRPAPWRAATSRSTRP